MRGVPWLAIETSAHVFPVFLYTWKRGCGVESWDDSELCVQLIAKSMRPKAWGRGKSGGLVQRAVRDE